MTLPPGTIPMVPSCGCVLCDFGLAPSIDQTGIAMHTAYRDGLPIVAIRCQAPPSHQNHMGKVINLNSDLPLTAVAP